MIPGRALLLLSHRHLTSRADSLGLRGMHVSGLDLSRLFLPWRGLLLFVGFGMHLWRTRQRHCVCQSGSSSRRIRFTPGSNSSLFVHETPCPWG